MARLTLRSTFQSLAVRNYRLFIVGHVVSDVGTWMQKVAQAWLVLEITGSGTLLGVAAALQSIPILVIGPVGGLLADRLDKRRLLIATHLGSGMVALALGLITATQIVEVWMVLLLALALGTLNALEKPARHTFVLDMVGAHRITNAVTLNSTVANLGKVVGPALAGILIAAVGLAWTFYLNAASYLAVVAAIALMRVGELHIVDRAESGAGSRGQLIEGLLYVRQTPRLLGPLVLIAVAGMLAYEWQVTLPLLARDAFNGDAEVFGAMFSAMGGGAVVGGLAIAGRSAPSGTYVLGLGFVFGALVLVVAWAPTMSIAILMLITLGAASIAFRAAAMSLMLLEAAPHLRGRVASLFILATAGTTPIGAPLVGWLAEVYGARVAISIGGVATVVAVALTWSYLLSHRALRSDPEPPAWSQPG